MIKKTTAGVVYGRLTVIEKDEDLQRASWLCKCECGKIKSIRQDHLRSGRTVSCGCHKVELSTKRLMTHGKSKTRTYRIWRDMINRCHYENYPERHLYGGRGIIVCDRWRFSFDNFIADMGEAGDGLSIDRINTNGNYEPGNCKWSTPKEQALNRRKPEKQSLGVMFGTSRRMAA